MCKDVWSNRNYIIKNSISLSTFPNLTCTVFFFSSVTFIKCHLIFFTWRLAWKLKYLYSQWNAYNFALLRSDRVLFHSDTEEDPELRYLLQRKDEEAVSHLPDKHSAWYSDPRHKTKPMGDYPTFQDLGVTKRSVSPVGRGVGRFGSEIATKVSKQNIFWRKYLFVGSFKLINLYIKKRILFWLSKSYKVRLHWTRNEGWQPSRVVAFCHLLKIGQPFKTNFVKVKLSNCSRSLRPVETFRKLSMTSNCDCFVSCLNEPKTTV